MNIHVVVEGVIGESRVYRHWIPLVNPSLSYVRHISLVRSNNFSIVAGGCYPNYYKRIEAAIQDVNTLNTIDRLVVAVDSEDKSYQVKLNDVQSFIQSLS